MDFVCHDANDTKWYFDESQEKYIRVHRGKTIRRISSVNLPDPDELLESRIQNATRQGLPFDREAMKPTKAVYALWKHKVANGL